MPYEFFQPISKRHRLATVKDIICLYGLHETNKIWKWIEFRLYTLVSHTSEPHSAKISLTDSSDYLPFFNLKKHPN